MCIRVDLNKAVKGKVYKIVRKTIHEGLSDEGFLEIIAGGKPYCGAPLLYSSPERAFLYCTDGKVILLLKWSKYLNVKNKQGV